MAAVFAAEYVVTYIYGSVSLVATTLIAPLALILLDAVIETIGETDYEMKSISGVVFIFSLSDRSFVLSLAGLIIKNLNNW